MQLRRIDAQAFNLWQAERHYLRRPIIRTKMLAHGIFVNDNLVGGLLWVTPHFTKKTDLFGYPNTLDKWEVLVLGRFYLIEKSGIIASQAMAESVGRGKTKRGSKRRGWRIQRDWILENPPKDANSPFVPRLLMSWSDTNWGHEGTIYKAAGWEFHDVTHSSGRRTGSLSHNDGHKRCWILRLPANDRVEEMGRALSPHQWSLL